MRTWCQGKHSGRITTLGRGGSDLTATIIGRALGLREVQVKGGGKGGGMGGAGEGEKENGERNGG